ncbi:E3 ubiquitin-protein ligase DTX3L-like isoform X2 [Salminus brasiliensis]|uniref:E3 ubiquitin-protein ligase DTX3L-like isoform X2 n=1 Tax=Salminus brasiliensis TaxID=930266 RepID=UPI003B83652D
MSDEPELMDYQNSGPSDPTALQNLQQEPISGGSQQAEQGLPGPTALQNLQQEPISGGSQQAEQQAQHRSVSDKEIRDMRAIQPAPPDPAQEDVPGPGSGATDGNGTKPSAPPDSAKLNIRVEQTSPLPAKWKAVLEIALQRWFNTELSELVGENCSIVKVQLRPDQCNAEVEIAPSKALNILKEKKTATLTFKDNRQATVSFLVDDTNSVNGPQNPEPPAAEKKVLMPEMDMSVTAVIDLDRWPKDVQKQLVKRFGKDQSGNKVSFSGSFVAVEKFYKEVCEVVGGSEAVMDVGAERNDPKVKIPQNPETSGDPFAFTVPLCQYWYLSHAYRKELRQIQDESGVKIEAEVSVSVAAVDQTRSDSVCEATQRFADLFQISTTNLKSLHIPKMQLDSDICKDVVRNIHTDQAKMMLTMSAEESLLCGPEPFLSAVQNQMNLKSEGSSQESGGSPVSSLAGKMETDSSYASRRSTLEMDIKDTQDPIVMSDALWKLMVKTSGKQLAQIECKYGVGFSPQSVQGFTKVTIQSKDNQHVNLESHALRAFMHLYQKIYTSAFTCPLNGPLQDETVSGELERHLLVGVEEKYGSWKLVGLPRNVVPAIADIEKLVGKPVFDDKTKQFLDYSEYSRQFRGHSRASPSSGVKADHGHSWGRQEASSTVWEQGSSLNSAANADHGKSKETESDRSKEDDCPICIDKFTDAEKLKCGHEFCRGCLQQSIKSMGEICPVCKEIFGALRGNQPKGNMSNRTSKWSLPGFSHCGTIEILYDIPGGVQTVEHPNPGRHYTGACRQAYLPDNAEGRRVLQLLERAFHQRLIFTVGTSTTTGAENTVTWNDIHHKTSRDGGPQHYGYPDPDYLKRVKEELKAKGIE